MPDVPTLIETGIAVEASSWWGLLAPAETPSAIIERLQKAMAEALATEAMRERLAQVGIEPESSTPAEFAALIEAETAKWQRIVKQAGIQAD